MRIRFVEGPGAPAEHDAVVDHFGVVIDERGYCPLDDMRGMVVVEVSDGELVRLLAHGFDLPVMRDRGRRWSVRRNERALQRR